MSDLRELPAWMAEAGAAGERGDLEGFLKGLLEGMAPTCTWRVPGRNPLAGVLEGHAGVESFFRRMFERSDGTLRTEPIEILAGERHVVIFVRSTADTPDGPVDVRVAHFATLDDEGRFDKNWFLPSDVDLHDRLLR